MNEQKRGNRLDLAVVMPVYNEAEIVNRVVGDWLAVLEPLGMRYAMRVYDDGSTDDTWHVLLSAWEHHPRVALVRQKNSGHGPTILRAYREALQADWIFQTDSDNEIGAQSFPTLWREREQYDFLIGVRHNRRSHPARQVVSLVSRLLIRGLFGAKMDDANTPFRLMRSSFFRPCIERIPPDTFAPNVLISGYAGHARARLFQTPVEVTPRQTGTCSLNAGKLARAALRSARQTIAFRKVLRTSL